MTKDEIILANKEFLFPAVFHYYKEPLVVARAKDSTSGMPTATNTWISSAASSP
ncbi:MAG TPA: hypothetical protein VLW65_07330 [Bryobacteraceae bacterium]|nr:hypothetical protein [Bryobacteraceae bacterium]